MPKVKIKLNPTSHDCSVETMDGDVIEGVYRIDIKAEVGEITKAIIYLRPQEVEGITVAEIQDGPFELADITAFGDSYKKTAVIYKE